MTMTTMIDGKCVAAEALVFQGLRFADAGKGFPLCLANQLVDAVHHFPVLLLPVQIVFPGQLGEYQLHSASSRSMPVPAFSWAVAARIRRAFSGVRRR